MKNQRYYFANQSLSNQSYSFSSSYIWMWELEYKESWAPKNWCFWTVVLKTLESPLDWEEIQPVHPKWNQSWIFIGRSDSEMESPILWPPDAKSRLIWKDPNAGTDWRQEKATTEDTMVGWYYRLDEHEFEQAPGLMMDREAWHAAVHESQRIRHNWATELNWLGFCKMEVNSAIPNNHYREVLKLITKLQYLSITN